MRQRLHGSPTQKWITRPYTLVALVTGNESIEGW
jgi:hypothetical protein